MYIVIYYHDTYDDTKMISLTMNIIGIVYHFIILYNVDVLLLFREFPNNSFLL